VAERIIDRWQNMSFLLETALKVCLQTLYGMQVQTRPEKIWKINYFYGYLNYEMQFHVWLLSFMTIDT
jgi:hypothetical protein